MQRYLEQAASAQKKVAELDGKIAQAHSRMTDAQRNLSRDEDREASDRDRKARHASDKVKRENEQTAKQHEARMRNIQRDLSDHGAKIRDAQGEIKRLSQLPERIVVLFMASSPLDQQHLRLDEEARAVGEMIQKAKHRDSIHLETRWAARSLDVLDAINRLQPTVLHFSGHGAETGELVFQDAAGESTFVTKQAIAAAISTASKAIPVVFFNSCFSAGQAEEVVKFVDAAVGMNRSIGDDAAREFAAAFYSAIGYGLSVATAFSQAKAALMLLNIPEHETPELHIRAGVDPDTLVLVRPEGESISNEPFIS